jgi:hypothetical protein
MRNEATPATAISDKEKKSLVYVFQRLLREFQNVPMSAIIEVIKTVRGNGHQLPYTALDAARRLLQPETNMTRKTASAFRTMPPHGPFNA